MSADWPSCTCDISGIGLPPVLKEEVGSAVRGDAKPRLLHLMTGVFPQLIHTQLSMRRQRKGIWSPGEFIDKKVMYLSKCLLRERGAREISDEGEGKGVSEPVPGRMSMKPCPTMQVLHLQGLPACDESYHTPQIPYVHLCSSSSGQLHIQGAQHISC